MIEFFTEMQGRYRLIWGLVLIGINLILLFFVGVVWLWLWDIAIVMLLYALQGEI